MQNDDLTAKVWFEDRENPLARRTVEYRNIHHAECQGGTLMLHSAEYGVVWAFSPTSGWSAVEVQTPPRGKKPGEA